MTNTITAEFCRVCADSLSAHGDPVSRTLGGLFFDSPDNAVFIIHTMDNDHSLFSEHF